MSPYDMMKTACEALREKKGENIRVIDISNVSVIADYFVIASGMNRNQVQALADNVQETLEKNGQPVKQIEGYGTANWILLDFGDIIVHVFKTEDRIFYDLERIWKDGREIEVL